MGATLFNLRPALSTALEESARPGGGRSSWRSPFNRKNKAKKNVASVTTFRIRLQDLRKNARAGAQERERASDLEGKVRAKEIR